MGEDAVVRVVIRAEDEASTSIAKIKGDLGSIGGVATTSAGAVNSALLSTTQHVGKLEQGLAKQKNVTRRYNEDLRTATKNLKAQKTAMSEAVKSYEKSKAATKANNAELMAQARSLDGAINLKKSEITSFEKANKGLDSNTQAYKDNKKAISWCTTELNDLEKRRKGIDTQISKNNSALQKEETAYKNAQTAVKRASAEFENTKAARDKSIAAEKDYSNAIKQSSEKNAGALRITSEQLEKAGKGTKDFFGNVDDVTKPLQAVSLGAITAGAASAKFAIDFEDNFANVKKTVDGTPEQLEAIEQGLIDLTTVGIGGRKAIPATTKDLTELAAAGGQLGIHTPNIVGFTEAMAQLDSATDLGGVDGAQTIAQLMNVANVDQGKIRNLGSTIVDLGNNYATTESKIANMALRVGATSTTIGFDIQDTLAYSTALSSMGVEAEAGGSALSRIMMDVQTAVSSGGNALKDFAKVSGESVQQFKEDWDKDSAEQLLDLIEGLSESKDMIKTLQELGFKNIYDIQALQKLASEKGIDVLTDALERANTAWDENIALQREADAKAETTAGQLAITKQNITEVGRSFGEFIIPIVAEASDDVRDFAHDLAGLSDEQKTGIVNTAKNIAIAGVATKGLVVAGKGIGGVVESVGKLGAAGPAVASVAAALTATYGLYKAAQAYEDYRADWSRGGYEMAESMREESSALRELNSLQYEYRELLQVVKNPDTDENSLKIAQTRLEEIKKLLAEKYNLDITVDDSQLDAVIEKAKKIQYLEVKQKIPDLLDYAGDKKDGYQQAKSDIDLYNQRIPAIKAEQRATKNLRNEILLLDEAVSKGTITQAEYNSKYNELIEATGNVELGNMPKEVLLEGTEINQWLESLSSALTDNETKLATAEAKMAEYKQAMLDLADAGLLEIEYGDFETGMQRVVTAVNNAELSVQDYALTIALMQSEFDSVDAAKVAGQFETVQSAAQYLIDTYFNIPTEIETSVVFEPDTTAVDNYEPEDKTATVTYGIIIKGLDNIPQGDSWVTPAAKGTQNFPGGLAMVNDQTGISDNRELIIDQGKAFIPQGKNVILPLSRGAKVYTASQTKALARALDIPGFASGKDNSDGFITARDNLTHRKSTSAMSVTDELAEWVKLSEQFKSNQRDVWDIQEQIYSLTRKQTDELNEQSKAYIKERTALADWTEYGDDPMSAFNRVKERNLVEFSAGRMTWQEYTDTMSEFGELMLDERISQSEKWLDHERKYNDMSVDDYIAGLQRMQEYTLQYYEQGLIDLEAYNAAASEINDNYLDAVRERNDNQYSAWEKSMDNWINMRETYGDWDEFGDSLSQTYARAIVRQEEFYNAGLISWQEKEDAKLEYSLEMYKAASDEYDAVLAEQSEHISEMRDKFAAEEEALRSSWEVKDRSTDLAEVERLLSIYKNAATDAGQEKYKELLEQKEQLERDEQLYQLQVDNNATLDKLQAEYDKMEANKKNVLARLKISSSDISSTNADISAEVESTRQIANEIGLVYSRAAESTLNSLGEVVNLLEGIKKALGGRSTNTYNDNKNISISSGVSESYVSKLINGTFVSGLGSIMFNG